MKFNFEHELLTAQTDSVFVAKQLILIIEELDRREEEKYAHDENGNRIPFKGAIIMPDPLDEPKKYIEPLKNRVKEDTPAMNITSRLHEEPVDREDEFVNHCVKQQAAKIKPAKGEKWPHEKFTSDEYPEENIPEITKPAESKPKDIEDEEIEIDSVPSDDEPKPEVPHGKKIKSSEIKPQEGTVEEAYLGEHFEITPDEPEEKPLTPAEQELWDYIQKNPNYTMQGACRDLGITQMNYYWRKRKLAEKGRKVAGAIPFASKPKD